MSGMTVVTTGSIRTLAVAMPKLSMAFAEKIANDLQAAAMQNIQAMGAVDTGNLLNSGEVVIEGSTIVVIFNADYSAYIHEGTRRMAARPFLRKAMEDIRGSLPDGVGLDVQLGGVSL